MKCYNHHNHDAVGVCKSCLKGICTECATDIGGGITCSDECATNAKDSIALLKSTVASQKDFKKGGGYVAPIFFLLMGLGFIGFSLYKEGFGEFGYLFGGLFTLFGIAIAFLNYRHVKRQR
ncbi:hypothetical protein GCM10009133_33650 [Cocleimonas flava]|uniref:B box-type domain-containing protein n=1 Tax=Cocleimonas flava TaxID=634765 RepID=A0A4R1FD83_9GAMM|nr:MULTISPECIES: hypothetical protein [Cocleimonas]MEB8431099.1 hypothetical protein [Cocleimonas sp. KMM 6892]MEC4714129.1 hypothetical protein [Cocleimonas sp. KMM 6895]MEC4743460.1 hypothetical protein [Cocleimonas sp. KMM 6896]TCJ88791.1 hypothetical protein EV695_0650 [Cocleimonas flava]